MVLYGVECNIYSEYTFKGHSACSCLNSAWSRQQYIYIFADSLPVEVSLDLGIFQNHSAGIDTYNRGYTNIYKVLQI